jgi:hypothetical protein
MVLYSISMMSVNAKKLHINHRFDRQIDDDSWHSNNYNYENDWNSDSEMKQVTIERKFPVPIFIEKIRHVPIKITKPIYIERTLPILHIVPRYQNYHHHHYTEYHHFK